MPKWINKEEFYKTFKRYAFINAQDEINKDYDPIDPEDEINKIEWKTYHSFTDEELLIPFIDGWNSVINRASDI